MSAQIPPALIDELMDRYVEWREACVALTCAYERWASVPVSERVLAFAAYGAALDWEEQASAVYANRINRIVRDSVGARGLATAVTTA